MAENGEKTSFTSFLFGNVDEQGNLAEDFLDEETKAHLSNLGAFLRRDPAFEKESSDSDSDSDENETESKAESAEDFADINEIADDDEQPSYSRSQMESSDDSSSSDDDDGYAFDGDDDEDDEEILNALTNVENPLANMLPEEYRNIDVKKFFPYFKKNKVLRFSRLFGPGKPSSLPRIWRGVKNRRKLASEKLSKTPRSSEVEEKSEEQKAVDSILEPDRREFKLDFAPTPPLDECETDDELKLKKPEQPSQKNSKGKTDRDESQVAPWRYGPAAYWYDKMNVSATGEGFNYNMKLKTKSSETESTEKKEEFEPELFLPLNLVRWEDDVIWDGEDARQEVLKKLTSGRQPLCGWIPTQQTRSYESFMAMLKSGGFSHVFGNRVMPSAQQTKPTTNTVVPNLDTSDGRASFAIFPPDNLELIYGDWEKDVIIDSNNMERIPEPKVLTLDLSEDPLLYGIPDDIPREDLNSSDDLLNKSSDRKEHQFTKKSQMILGKVAQRQREEEEEAAQAQMTEKDPFNLSNDEFYLPKGSSTVTTFGGSMIQHSIPGQNLNQPFFPTHLNIFKLRHFHRLPLKKIQRSVLSKPTFHSVQILEKHVQKIAKAREQQRLASGGGEMFFMREPEDLSGKDGDLILCEYSEEHPPLIMQPGMATKIKNYYKRRPGKETNEPKFEFGETSYTHSSPFLGSLSPGESLQALENNLFRAPLYQHRLSLTDFLIVRDRHGYYIRSVATLYAVGQECPVHEVPSPNSKRASNFVRDYLLVFIYRLFWQSRDTPRRLKMEDIRRAFPHYAESSIRKRLKICSDFKRLGQGPESNYWVLRSDFRLPTLEEVRSMVSPETCCAYFSMLAAEQRLKDAGYGERYFFTPEDDDDDNEQVKMADEIKCAPWNTTRAYISAMKGKCLLDLTGVADPTGCGEGFSYVKVTAKPPKDEAPQPVKRTVTGTDADLRKLSLKDAKQLLRDFGVKDDEIKTLTRWEIIDVIRTLSTQQARTGGTGITKFARGSMRFSLAEVQDRYKQECQRIFDLQGRVLSNAEYLSTDDEESEGGDSDIEEMGKNIETMLTSKKGAPIEDEKKEREELQRLLRGEPLDDKRSTGDGKNRAKKSQSSSQDADDDPSDGRKLKIFRTFRTNDGREYVTSEVITKSQLIEAYVKIRTTKDEAFIKHFAQMDEQFKEEKRREKRRLQDQLRRIRRNELKAKMGLPVGRPQKIDKPRKTPPPPKPSLLKMRCSACGGNGHMKTNKNCPLYGKASKLPPQSVALTDEQMEQEFELSSAENLLTVEGTKIKFSKSFVEQTRKIKKKSLKLKFPKHFATQQQTTRPLIATSSSAPDLLSPSSDDEKTEQTPTHREPLRMVLPKIPKMEKEVKQRRPYGGGQHAEYLAEGPKQSVQRRRADPRVTMSVVLEQILNELKSNEHSRSFFTPVSKKLVPDYYKIVKRPMDLQIIKMNLKKNHYVTREEFLKDFGQILDNSRLYNGDQHPITQSARVLFELTSKRIAEKEQKLMKLEKLINPLLDDNDLVAFCFILERIIDECKKIPKSFTFHHPVDKKKYKNYAEKIGRPMDLGTMELKCKRHLYQTVGDFLRDADQIYMNSEVYNGPTSPYTTKAKDIMETARKLVERNAQHLAELEKNIQAAKEKAIEAMETESHATGASSLAGDIGNERQEDLIDEGDSTAITVNVGGDEESLLQQDLLLSDGEDETGVGGGQASNAGYSGSYTDFSVLRDELGVDDEPPSSVTTERRDDVEDGELIESRYPSDSESRMGDEELAELLDQSAMARSGRLQTDLAMSDSDDNDDGDEPSGKRMRTMSEEDCDFSTM